MGRGLDPVKARLEVVQVVWAVGGWGYGLELGFPTHATSSQEPVFELAKRSLSIVCTWVPGS